MSYMVANALKFLSWLNEFLPLDPCEPRDKNNFYFGYSSLSCFCMNLDLLHDYKPSEKKSIIKTPHGDIDAVEGFGSLKLDTVQGIVTIPGVA